VFDEALTLSLLLSPSPSTSPAVLHYKSPYHKTNDNDNDNNNINVDRTPTISSQRVIGRAYSSVSSLSATPSASSMYYSSPASTSSSSSVSVSVSSLLVSLSVCEAEVSAKTSSLLSAQLHISSLEDKMSMLTEGLESLEYQIVQSEETNRGLHAEMERIRNEADINRNISRKSIDEANERILRLFADCDRWQSEHNRMMNKVEEMRKLLEDEHLQHCNIVDQMNSKVEHLQHHLSLYKDREEEWNVERERLLTSESALSESLSIAMNNLNSDKDVSSSSSLTSTSSSERATVTQQQVTVTDIGTETQSKSDITSSSLPVLSSDEDCPPSLLMLVESQLWEEMTELREFVKGWNMD
jgi:chromosome segregation ATPase